MQLNLLRAVFSSLRFPDSMGFLRPLGKHRQRRGLRYRFPKVIRLPQLRIQRKAGGKLTNQIKGTRAYAAWRNESDSIKTYSPPGSAAHGLAVAGTPGLPSRGASTPVLGLGLGCLFHQITPSGCFPTFLLIFV